MKQSQNPVWNVSLVKYVMSSALRRECQQPSVCLHLSRVTTGLDYTTNEYILVLCNTYSYFYLSQVTPHVSEPLCEPCSVWPNVVNRPKKIRNFSCKKIVPLLGVYSVLLFQMSIFCANPTLAWHIDPPSPPPSPSLGNKQSSDTFIFCCVCLSNYLINQRWFLISFHCAVFNGGISGMETPWKNNSSCVSLVALYA